MTFRAWKRSILVSSKILEGLNSAAARAGSRVESGVENIGMDAMNWAAHQ